MRWTRALTGVTASLRGVAAGATHGDDTPIEEDRERVPLAREQPAGFAESGPCFYVWEEDSWQAKRWAAELARRLGPPAERSGPDEPGGSDQPPA